MTPQQIHDKALELIDTAAPGLVSAKLNSVLSLVAALAALSMPEPGID